MASLRTIKRQHILMRREEANRCLEFGLCHAATLTACSGIELLLELLIGELYKEFSRQGKRRANSLLRAVEDEESRNSAKTRYWGLKSWADFYKRRSLFEALSDNFDLTLRMLNHHTLSQANETWNRCKHDPYLATEDTASKTVGLLNEFLNETKVESAIRMSQKMTIAEMSAFWLAKWEAPIARWLAENHQASPASILMYLAPLLDLLIRLIDDNRVAYEHKTPLLVAANYVFSSTDLMPEASDGSDVNGLIDDGAVLVLTVYWLMQQENFDRSLLFAHWPGGESIVGEIQELKERIWEKQADLFPESRNQLGHQLVWKIIERIAVDGPEALWQNYWKEQYSQAAIPQN